MSNPTSTLDSNLFIMTYLTLHPEWVNDVKLVVMDGETTFWLSANFLAVYTVWLASEGICDKDKARDFLKFIDKVQQDFKDRPKGS